jgi:F0F1-type ATP synthase assembly protein I
VLNSVAAGRRLAQRAIIWQAAVTVLLAVVFLIRNVPSALAALAGGGSVMLGFWISTRVALGGGVAPAGAALGRLVAGMLLKWLLILLVIAVVMGVFRLPGLPLLVGIAASVLASVPANSIRR